MQPIRVIAEELHKAIAKIIPSVANDEKYTAAQICVVALHHADLAVSQNHDYKLACKCMFALQPFRTMAEEFARGRTVDIIDTAYTCAVLLKKLDIDQASHIDEIVARLGPQLSNQRRLTIDKWTTERTEEFDNYGPAKDQDAWAVVGVMINTKGGLGYKAALVEIAERSFRSRKAVEQWNQYVQQSKAQSDELIGKALPFGGSIVAGPNSASVHFGLGGGSVTVVNGQLSVILPRKN